MELVELLVFAFAILAIWFIAGKVSRTFGSPPEARDERDYDHQPH